LCLLKMHHLSADIDSVIHTTYGGSDVTKDYALPSFTRASFRLLFPFNTVESN